MARPIFRKEALDHLASPEQLDQLMPVARPRAWIALAAVGLVLVIALLWSVFGTIPTTVDAPGILLRRGGLTTVEAPIAGVVTTIKVFSGDGVTAGQELLQLAPVTPRADGVEITVCSPVAARVLQRPIREGDKVKEGDALMVLEPLDEPLRVRLFVPVGEGYSVQPGMSVRVWPAQVNRSESGYLIGTVRAASKYPIAPSELARVTQNEDQARQLAGAGPCLQVFVELKADPATASGCAWSSSRGAATELYSGMPCQGSVILGEERPIQLVFPGLGSRGGRGP